ncbi:autotransporter outer membrane beta-barrel domain-containing protein [Terasakiella sp. A23]|uniref:autotransporter outer membrane beta-barrel domain-containing protein n=1 Tax=Terasakiella sp. FCG-A23 TaxID=3080561 RepID=UPI002952DE2F|nr:autotransporter outer membrane beta-barrel domain-containing protein [Terasakiella sp. A23]MDV7338632.1 autotransporter outer membrane beta-barrel domain-containing protein [Terasakiella sp. A23]
MKKLLALAGVTLLAGQFVGGSAHAADCTTSGYSSTYGGCSGNAAAASSTVTSAQTVAAASAATAGLVSNRLASITAGGQSTAKLNTSGNKLSYSLDMDENGKAAGMGAQKFGVWIDFTGAHFDNADKAADYDGELYSGMIGFDYRLNDNVIVGLSGGYEKVETTTTFNAGSEDVTGWTVTPYLGYIINKNYSVDASIGYSKLDYDMERIDATNQTAITGTTEADRIYGALNVNGNWNMDNVLLGASLGTLYAKEEKDAFTESGAGATSVAAQDTKLGRISIGGNIGYDFGMITPYLKAKYGYDYEDGGSGDDNMINGGLGVNFDFGSSVSAGLESTATKKGDYTDVGGSVNLRVQF